MTTPDLRRRPHQAHRTRAAGAFGVAVVAAATILTAGTGAAAAATPAEILTAACTHYEPNPNIYLQRRSDCKGADLTGANLTRTNLTGANLDGAILEQANLTGAILEQANLTDANLTRANLTGMWLRGANLTGANLTDVTLSGTDMTGANLTRTNLTRVSLNNTNWTGSNAVPSAITIAATSWEGATVTWNPPMPTGLTLGSCTPESGTVFYFGTHTVRCDIGNTETATTGYGFFSVTVTDYLAAPVFDDTAPVKVAATVDISLTPWLFAVEGAPAPQITVDASKLPPGLIFKNRVLSGTPTTAGVFPFTLTATNNIGNPATLQVTVTVAKAPGTDPGPSTGSLGSLDKFFGFGS